MKRQVVISFLGSVLDSGTHARRWEKWRPNIGMCQQDDLVIDRLELIYDKRITTLLTTVRRDIAMVSPETEVRPQLMDLRDPWDFEEVYAALHDFARAYPFDPETEDYLIQITTGTHVAQICMYLLTEAHYFPGRLLQLSPPRGRSGLIAGTYSIIDLDLSRYDRIATRFEAERDEAASFLKSGIATRNAAFNHMIDQIEHVAIRSSAPVLLMGPTGAGKSHLARRIHELKQARRQLAGPFVEINCATLRGDGAMSTLFGHTKGAFTGAVGARPGLLRAADSGMLFLDEIGELGLDEQAMILRAIEDRTFLPVGSDKPVQSDFQLIAGTNRNLGQAVREGRFREDLYARLNLWTFHLPGLRDRREDIEPNIAFELARHRGETGRNVTMNREAERRFLAFALDPASLWSANFRDLAASITRMATLAPSGRITEDVVAEEIARLRLLWRGAETSGGEAVLADVLPPERLDAVDPFDRPQLARVIETCRRHRSLSAAGRELFAASRREKSTHNDADRLRKYLARFGLAWGDVTAP